LVVVVGHMFENCFELISYELASGLTKILRRIKVESDEIGQIVIFKDKGIFMVGRKYYDLEKAEPWEDKNSEEETEEAEWKDVVGVTVEHEMIDDTFSRVGLRKSNCENYLYRKIEKRSNSDPKRIEGSFEAIKIFGQKKRSIIENSKKGRFYEVENSKDYVYAYQDEEFKIVLSTLKGEKTIELSLEKGIKSMGHKASENKISVGTFFLKLIFLCHIYPYFVDKREFLDILLVLDRVDLIQTFYYYFNHEIFEVMQFGFKQLPNWQLYDQETMNLFELTFPRDSLNKEESFMNKVKTKGDCNLI
jgi:hypothetical protein